MQSKSVNHLICAFLRRCIRQMKKLGLNQTQLAQRLHVSRPYVTKLLSGDVNISFGAAMRLARALEMDFLPELRERQPKKSLTAVNLNLQPQPL